ncbi:MAG: DUF4424 family protein [Terriglobia bacterium]
MRAAVVLCGILFLLICSPANANDTFATLGAGGLVSAKSTQIVMESEHLQISVHQITVRYLFRNDTAKDVEAIVAFPLPDLDGGGIYNVPIELPRKSDWNFVDFKVRSNGQPIPVKMETRARNGDRDINARLRALGVPVSVLLEPLNSALMKLSAAQRAELEKEHLIVRDGFNPPLRSVGREGWWATWTMQVKFYWTQRFPANSIVELVQTYRPVVGGSYFAEESDGEESVQPYCGGAEALRQIERIKQSHERKGKPHLVFHERCIDYILTTANNWRGPIRHFRLSVQIDSPDDIVLTCRPRLERTKPTLYEFSQENFRPDRDLKLMILQAKQQD